MKIPSTALILVTVMPSTRDLEIARLLGWYRIPFANAPKVIGVDYLAFYQPSAFGERKWYIDYYAPVKGYELVNRIELFRDEPQHPRAYEEYYKIAIGTLQALDTPIHAEQWKRITFLYTTGEYFNQAKTINELVVHSEERALLWKALHEKAVHYSLKSPYPETLPDISLEPEVLAVLLGIKEDLICPR